MVKPASFGTIAAQQDICRTDILPRNFIQAGLGHWGQSRSEETVENMSGKGQASQEPFPSSRNRGIQGRTRCCRTGACVTGRVSSAIRVSFDNLARSMGPVCRYGTTPRFLAGLKLYCPKLDPPSDMAGGRGLIKTSRLTVLPGNPTAHRFKRFVYHPCLVLNTQRQSKWNREWERTVR